MDVEVYKNASTSLSLMETWQNYCNQSFKRITTRPFLSCGNNKLTNFKDDKYRQKSEEKA